MSLNAATEGELGDLHKMLCKYYRKMLRKKEVDPRLLGHMNKFLSDSKIQSIVEPGNDISELAKDLQKRKRRFGAENITDIATEQAKREAIG